MDLLEKTVRKRFRVLWSSPNADRAKLSVATESVTVRGIKRTLQSTFSMALTALNPRPAGRNRRRDCRTNMLVRMGFCRHARCYQSLFSCQWTTKKAPAVALVNFSSSDRNGRSYRRFLRAYDRCCAPCSCIYAR